MRCRATPQREAGPFPLPWHFPHLSYGDSYPMRTAAGPRVARRRATIRRVRVRVVLFGALLWLGLWTSSPLGLGEAAPPGSLTITSMGCYPSVSVDIRVSALSSSPTKTNVVSISWSDGTTTTNAPDQVIPQSAVDGSQPTDVYHLDWLSEPGSEPSTFTATATVALSWTASNGNSKEVSTATLSELCGIA